MAWALRTAARSGPHHRLRAKAQRHIISSVALRIGQRAHGRERRHEKRAALFHFGQGFIVDPGAVLDAADARPHRICAARRARARGRPTNSPFFAASTTAA
jgi:hypothetical protein